jgi:tetratricopeptide (TPR) repeat protein
MARVPATHASRRKNTSPQLRNSALRAGSLRIFRAAGTDIRSGEARRDGGPAAQRDVWQDLRSLAYFGLCDSQRLLNNFDTAIGYCQKALTYDPSDPYAHFALALSYTSKAQASGAVEPLVPARKHFSDTISLNPDMAESERAKKYIARIDALLQSVN